VTYLKVLPEHSLARTEENHENLKITVTV